MPKVNWILIALLALSGCGPVGEVTSAANLKTKTPPTPPQPDSCQILRSDFNNAAVELTAPQVTHKVERKTKRIIRYSCSGSVASDRIETVDSPRFVFNLDLPEALPHKAVFVFNETSCDHKLTRMPIGQEGLHWYAVYGDGEKRTTIWGDIASALATFNVDPGLNRIFVRYYESCSPKDVAGNEHQRYTIEPFCDGEPKSRTVLFPVLIDYKETLLPEVGVDRPTKESCDREAQRGAVQR